MSTERSGFGVIKRDEENASYTPFHRTQETKGDDEDGRVNG